MPFKYASKSGLRDASKRRTASPVKATGGTVTVTGGFVTHTFNDSGTFTPNGEFSVEYLVVAGGGGAGIPDPRLPACADGL